MQLKMSPYEICFCRCSLSVCVHMHAFMCVSRSQEDHPEGEGEHFFFGMLRLSSVQVLFGSLEQDALLLLQ